MEDLNRFCIYKGADMYKNRLNNRELQILKLLSENLTNKEISDKIHISIHTVKMHNTNIYKKLDAKNRTQAVLNALRNGYIKLDNS